MTPTTGHVASHLDAGTERQRAQLRRRQWRAIAGAALLISWNGVPREPPSQAPYFFAEAKPAPAPEQRRESIIATVQQRNPRLGRGRAERIADSVLRCTESEQLTDLTPRLMLSVMFQESGARPSAISPKGAIGLMQVMPETYHRLELAGGIAHLESNIEAEQPWGSVEAGVEFTQYLHDRSLYRVEVSGETSIRIARGSTSSRTVGSPSGAS